MYVKKLMVVLSAVMLLTAIAAGTIYADAEPIGGCPDGFARHSLDHHPGEGGDHPHKHVGNDEDKNGDGYICGKHVGKDGSVHVHIDNNVPLDD